VISGPALIVGAGLTKTVISSVEVQVPEVAVSVYVVVTVGVAVGFKTVVELKVAPGDQTYVIGKVPPPPVPPHPVTLTAVVCPPVMDPVFTTFPLHEMV
jgi:hypothetical protein